MWNELPEIQREEYKKMILGLAGLTKVFAQKAGDTGKGDKPIPAINSKYQESVFQKAFHATAEDIGNTSYDASLKCTNSNGKERKYLVGIKTFGYSTDFQKIAQFKKNNEDWAGIIKRMKENSIDSSGNKKTKEEIDKENNDLYLSLAKQIAQLRNERIKSSKSRLQGFFVSEDDKSIQSIYHVLMPSIKGDKKVIFVGELPYDEIDIDNISILGCTQQSNPTNFDFTDGIHTYRFTSADTQLLMNFNNKDIVIEEWTVQYADDPYDIMMNISSTINEEKTEEIPAIFEKVESYSWKITNRDGTVEKYSGYNSFYGVGSKLEKDQRKKRIEKIAYTYQPQIGTERTKRIIGDLEEFLLKSSKTDSEKTNKAELRKRLINYVAELNNAELERDIKSLVFRPKDEMYIPIPNSRSFHTNHPDFFAPSAGTFIEGTSKLAKTDKEERSFNLVFEPSGDSIRSYITQDNGKAIESRIKQTDLGEWILRDVFQLRDYEPLTKDSLERVGINGIRLLKHKGSPDIHISFIWIDNEYLPSDYIGYTD